MLLREDERETLRLLTNKYSTNEELRTLLLLFQRSLGQRTVFGTSNIDYAYEVGKRACIDELIMNLNK